MPAERCRVGAVVNGAEQFYQRDTEQKRDGRWVAIPYFVLNRREAITMSEAHARAFLDKLRSLGVTNAWIEDAKDGRRIEHEASVQSGGEDNRVPLIATLGNVDDANATWYLVRPTCTPNGKQWFLTMFVPGLPERVTIYANDPVGVLERAQTMNYLQFAEKYVRPEPPQQPIKPGSAVRRRPGDLR